MQKTPGGRSVLGGHRDLRVAAGELALNQVISDNGGLDKKGLDKEVVDGEVLGGFSGGNGRFWTGSTQTKTRTKTKTKILNPKP